MIVAGEIEDISDISIYYAMKGNIAYGQNYETYQHHGET